jgi:hypothetical protein
LIAAMTGQEAAIAVTKRGRPLAVDSLLAAWRVWLPIMLVCGAGLVSVVLGPDDNWDLRYYHLYAPWAYLHHRYLHDIGPAQSQGFFNPAADFLFYALISSSLNESPRIVAFIMGAVHGINAVLVLAIACHVLRSARIAERTTLRAAALVIGVTGAGAVSLLGTTTNDLINSIFALGALLGLLKIAQPTPERAAWRDFAWPGLVAGIGVGLKYTAVIFAPALGLLALIAAVRRRTAAGLIVFGVAALLAALAVAGHHLFTLWRDFGNPTFPFLNQIFQSPYYEPEAIRDRQFLPRDVWQVIAYPFYWTKTTSYLVTEMTFRDWRGAIAYAAIAAGLLKLAVGYVSSGRHRARAETRDPETRGPETRDPETRGPETRDPETRDPQTRDPETRDLGLVFIFMVVSFVTWELGFGLYRYAVALEMLTGVVAMGALIWLVEGGRIRIIAAVALLAVATTTTVYPDWGRGQYGERYVDVRVPALPPNSVVLIATWEPAAYFIPFAEPTAQYLGIENNYLQLWQNNKLAAEVKRIMRTPGRPKFVLSVGAFDPDKLNNLLGQSGLKLSTSPCQPIRSNLEGDDLSLCPVADD